MRPVLEVADVMRRHGPAYRARHAGHLNRDQLKVMGAIESCRTATLGGHVDICCDCDFERPAYNSCRNRHCPKCQGAARAKWLADREAELLHVPYYHVVFTLPPALAEIAFQNKGVVYDIQFKATAESLRTVAADPGHLGADIGFLAVLHTWGQTMQHHPHVHCVVPGGGLAPDGSRWIPCRPGFFLPVRVLSQVYRERFLHHMNRAFEQGRLGFFNNLAPLTVPAAFSAMVEKAREIDWVVYAKRPFAGPETVLKYLSRYTHRVAIANSRLVAMNDDRVSFQWKDYRADGTAKVMTVQADEFIRRFLLHVLPEGIHRIRQFGFLANGQRGEKLALCRKLLKGAPLGATPEQALDIDVTDGITGLGGIEPCPCCGGLMRSGPSLPRQRPETMSTGPPEGHAS